MTKAEYIPQIYPKECGYCCAGMLLNQYVKDFKSTQQLFHHQEYSKGLTLKALVTLLEMHRVKPYVLQKSIYDNVPNTEEMWISHLKTNHYVLVESVDRNKTVIIDPKIGRVYLDSALFEEMSTGYAIHIRKNEENKQKIRKPAVAERIYSMMCCLGVIGIALGVYLTPYIKAISIIMLIIAMGMFGYLFMTSYIKEHKTTLHGWKRKIVENHIFFKSKRLNDSKISEENKQYLKQEGMIRTYYTRILYYPFIISSMSFIFLGISVGLRFSFEKSLLFYIVYCLVLYLCKYFQRVKGIQKLYFTRTINKHKWRKHSSIGVVCLLLISSCINMALIPLVYVGIQFIIFEIYNEYIHQFLNRIQRYIDYEQ